MLATKKPAGWMRSPRAAISPLAVSMTTISSASGSSARTNTPAEVLCMPRNAKGSSCRPATIASTSRLGRCGMFVPGRFRPRHLLDDSQNPVERDRDPPWTVGKLVRHFVDGCFEREEIDQRLGLQFARGIGGATAHHPAICGAEAVDRTLPPGFGERVHPRHCRRTGLAELAHRRGRGVVERPDHSGDIAQRRALAPPCRERPARLAFEIDQIEIVLHRDHLAEMEIAVIPG